MAIRNQSNYQSNVDTLIDNTGSGGTSGSDVEQAFYDLSDSVEHTGSILALASGTTFDAGSFKRRTATATYTTNADITLTNDVDGGTYSILITKNTSSDLDITFSHASHSIVTPSEEDLVTITGITGSLHLITIRRIGTVLVVTSDYGSQRTSQVRVSVSSGELLTLNSSPKLLIAAPGSGFAIEIIDVIRHYEYGASTYAGAGASDVQLNYGNSSDLPAAAGFTITQTQDYVQKISSQIQQNKTDIDNAAIYLYSPTGDPTTGDGTDEYVIDYKIIDLR